MRPINPMPTRTVAELAAEPCPFPTRCAHVALALGRTPPRMCFPCFVRGMELRRRLVLAAVAVTLALALVMP